MSHDVVGEIAAFGMKKGWDCKTKPLQGDIREVTCRKNQMVIRAEKVRGDNHIVEIRSKSDSDVKASILLQANEAKWSTGGSTLEIIETGHGHSCDISGNGQKFQCHTHSRSLKRGGV